MHICPGAQVRRGLYESRSGRIFRSTSRSMLRSFVICVVLALSSAYSLAPAAQRSTSGLVSAASRNTVMMPLEKKFWAPAPAPYTPSPYDIACFLASEHATETSVAELMCVLAMAHRRSTIRSKSGSNALCTLFFHLLLPYSLPPNPCWQCRGRQREHRQHGGEACAALPSRSGAARCAVERWRHLVSPRPQGVARYTAVACNSPHMPQCVACRYTAEPVCAHGGCVRYSAT